MLGEYSHKQKLCLGRTDKQAYDVSIVLPLFNENENIVKMYSSIKEALKSSNRSIEFIYVNDGSNDGSEDTLDKLYQDSIDVSVIHLYRKCGKAPALELGIELAVGNYIVIIDCDLQYDANDIPKMLAELEAGYDVVSGRRIHREDSKRMVITSRLFNWIVRKVTGLMIKDYFSGLKCFKKDVIAYLSLFGDLYRFASVYAHKQGFKVKEIPIRHYHRVHGRSRYNMVRRLSMALFDIMTIIFTVIFNQDRVYYLGAFGLFLLSFSTICFFCYFIMLKSGHQELVHYVNYVGFAMLFLGIQTLIIKQISKDFFVRHHETFYKRRRNIKRILSR